MQWVETFLNVTTYCETASNAILLIALFRKQLSTIYWGASFFVFITFLMDVIVLTLGPDSHLYYALYVAAAGIQIFALGVISSQIYAPIRSYFPGFIILARKTLIGAFVTSALIGALAVPATIERWKDGAFACPEFKLLEFHRFMAAFFFVYVSSMYKYVRSRKLNTPNTTLWFIWLCAYLPGEVIGDITVYLFRDQSVSYYLASILVTLFPAAANLVVATKIMPDFRQQTRLVACHNLELNSQVRMIRGFITNELKTSTYSALSFLISKALGFDKHL